MSNTSNNIIDVFHAITASKHSSNLKEELTQAEVASIMGLTRCGVQQIETRALEKLKRVLQKNNIKSMGDLI
jgi:DNA-directed RNA polymerase specialized sigma subunit